MYYGRVNHAILSKPVGSARTHARLFMAMTSSLLLQRPSDDKFTTIRKALYVHDGAYTIRSRKRYHTEESLKRNGPYTRHTAAIARDVADGDDALPVLPCGMWCGCR